MNNLNLRDILLTLADTSLDHSMHPLIKKWDNNPTALQILEVLDHCINGSLASGLIVRTLQLTYEGACLAEGVTHEDVVKGATWRGAMK